MAHACNEICENYRATRPSDGKRYGSGQKHCRSCSVFITWEGVFCPCCGKKLRVSPRHTGNREELRLIKATTGVRKKQNIDYHSY